MFGKRWTPATGVIIDSRIVGGGHQSAQTSAPATSHEFVVDVTTQEGATFRTLVEQPSFFGDWWTPRIGTRLRFEHHRKSGKVRFDTSDPAISFKAHLKARDDSFGRSLAQPPRPPEAD